MTRSLKPWVLKKCLLVVVIIIVSVVNISIKRRLTFTDEDMEEGDQDISLVFDAPTIDQRVQTEETRTLQKPPSTTFLDILEGLKESRKKMTTVNLQNYPEKNPRYEDFDDAIEEEDVEDGIIDPVGEKDDLVDLTTKKVELDDEDEGGNAAEEDDGNDDMDDSIGIKAFGFLPLRHKSQDNRPIGGSNLQRSLKSIKESKRSFHHQHKDNKISSRGVSEKRMKRFHVNLPELVAYSTLLFPESKHHRKSRLWSRQRSDKENDEELSRLSSTENQEFVQERDERKRSFPLEHSKILSRVRRQHKTTTRHPHTTSRPKQSTTASSKGHHNHTVTTKPLINLVPAKKNITCEEPAYREFPPDIFGQTLRKYGFIIVHIGVVCYMFYCLAVVCDNHFLPSLEECSLRLGLSDDVAGATFMAAGSSAPELFTALLGVFVAKGDVGTGTIVGSAVFNILFVIGLCGVFTKSAKLNWWPVMRDSSYYAITVLVLIACIYDGRVGTFESSFMLILYALYIVVMKFNVELRELVVAHVPVKQLGLEPHGDMDENEDVFETEPIKIGRQQTLPSSQEEGFGFGGQPDANYQSVSMDDPWSQTAYDPWSGGSGAVSAPSQNVFPSAAKKPKNYIPPSEDPRKTSLFEAANTQILKHKFLFRPRTRFMAAANLIIIKNRKAKTSSKLSSVKKAGPSKAHQKRVISAVRQDTVHGTRKPSIAPEPQEWLSAPNPSVVGWLPVIKWSLVYPLHAALFYTIPDCKKRPLLFLATFLMSVLWLAIFSYVMVWMVTIIGFTFGIPDSVMGITFLAAGTSIPDAYASIHVARAGQADMAVSNSIGSNVFDILIGLALPWFLQTAVVYPGSVATVKSMGLAYTTILLFVTLIATVLLIHLFKWTLKPALGYSLLSVYAVFLVAAVSLEFNILGVVNPPMCE